MSVPHEVLEFERSGFFRQLSLRDWAFFALMAAFVMTALGLYGARMDRYDIGGLLLAVGTSAWVGWYWRPWQIFAVSVGILALMYKAIALGVAFFTIATVLRAMWAAEAWAATGPGTRKRSGR